MIKQITFDEIKPYWKKLWPHVDINNLKPVQMLELPFVDSIFLKLEKQCPGAIPVTFIGYFIGEKIIGVQSGYKTSSEYFRIRGMWVDEEYRNKGIASSIVSAIEDIALSKNCKIVWTVPRKQAIGFWKKLGYEQITDFIMENNNNCLSTKHISSFKIDVKNE